VKPKNRAKLARRNAGLSIGQAARLLRLTTDDVVSIEETNAAFSMADHAKLADVYGVNIPWLKGEVPQHDYDTMNSVDGFDKVTPNDQAVLAEFAASMPRQGKTAAERLANILKKKDPT
jgi:predicted transcriptional regulator